MSNDNAPMCACGCMHPVSRIKVTNTSRGVRKGDWARYIRGHNYRDPATSAKRSGKKRSPLEPQWRKMYAGHETACHIWNGTKNAQGYGRTTSQGKSMLAHRKAWADARGPIPDGMVVMHLCDNPDCVRVEHLRLGSQKDNLRDMHNKSRSGWDTGGRQRG